MFIVGILLLVGIGNYDRILVVDVSGSMRRNNLHERVKAGFKEYVAKCEIGDRIILMTFGTDVNPGVEDRVIQSTNDIAEIQRKIDGFEFNDQWTWMTKAFDIIFKRITDLQKAYPDRPKYILVFTDGRNEPPPGHEDEFTFEEIIEKYGATIRKERTYLYVIMYQVTPSPELRNLVKEMEGEIYTTTTPPAFQEVQLGPEWFKFTFPLSDTLSKEFEIKVKKFLFDRTLPIYFEVPSQPRFNLSLIPRSFNATHEGQQQKFTITLTGVKEAGTYRFTIFPKTDMRNVILTPQKLAFEIIVKKPIKIPGWIWAIVAIVILIPVSRMTYCKLMVPKFPSGYYIVKKRKINDKVVESYKEEIKNYQKGCSNIVKASDMGIEECEFKIKIERDGKIKKILPEEGETEIIPGDKIIGDYYFEIEETM